MQNRVYLDWNATAPLRREARAAMLAALEAAGNASSVHAEGRQARALVEVARVAVAAAVGAPAEAVVFTSGGTEANAMALTPALRSRLFVSAIEHPSVLAGGQFAPEDIARIAVTPDGVLDLGDLDAKLAAAGPALVSVMLANNETGAIQPIADVAARVHAAGGLLHVDAVQGLGKIPIDINALGADMLTVSAHKIGGPQGVGALIAAGPDRLPPALLRGGGQERRRRAGTENVAGIAGFGAAATAAVADMPAAAPRIAALRDRLEAGLRAVSGSVVFADGGERLPNTILAARPGVRADVALIGFDLAGIAVSSGSACSSGKVEPSHVLAAMGVAPALAQGAIRISLGPDTTEDDIRRCLEGWRKR